MATVLFHRPARRYPEPVGQGAVTLVEPPKLPAPQGALASILQTTLPLVMTVGSLSMMIFFPTGILLKIVMGGVAALTVVGTFATKALTSREHRRQRREERTKYLSYLDRQEQEVEGHAARQRAALARIHPDLLTAWRRAADRVDLWERRPQDEDFLEIRVGTGRRPLLRPAMVNLDQSPFVEHNPELLAAVNDLVSRYTSLDLAPQTLQIGKLSSLSMVGDPQRARSLARALICHGAIYHAPDDLAVMACFPRTAHEQWEWLKWLPHCRAPEQPALLPHGPLCLLADNDTTGAQLLAEEVQRRRDAQARGILDTLPHLIVVVDSFSPRSPLAQQPVFREVLHSGSGLRICVICLAESRSSEPSHVEARLDLDSDGTMAYDQPGHDHLRFHHAKADSCDLATADSIARLLAPLRLEERSHDAAEVASGTVRLLDLLHFKSPREVDPQRTWKPRPRGSVMRTPIGVTSDGEVLYLDLKEAAAGGMGPHGLVIGATGSGKSELLRTLVTGLAIEHPPDILNFVFVDFKGGAAFADLSELPHVAGMITNLQGDSSRVDRMYEALVGEQDRRQRLLRDAGNLDGIKEYQARYAQDRSLPPMPYLLLVVDEFGELLATRPEFLELFMQIGRVGRSLGMHLLFATQKLDEGKIRGLEGHLRYRICLRTFSEAESKAVLGTPDAFNLPSVPGAGYFKVDTLYQRFQAALISGPARDAAALSGPAPADQIRPFSGIRSLEQRHEPTSPEPAEVKGSVTEMEVAIGRLRQRGDGLAPAVHKVWLPPLLNAFPLDVVVRQAATRFGVPPTATSEPFGPLRVPVATLDLPAQQDQIPMLLDFSGVGGHLALAGAAQTGKSTFLRTLIGSFAITHSPEEVQFYVIDFGGGSLHPLEQLPHVGAVCGKLERERVRRLIREVQSVIEERELLFRRHNIDSVGTFRRLRGRGTLPADAGGDVFLVIDNWSQLRSDYEEIDGEIAKILASGLGFGVHVLVTLNRWGDLKVSLKDNIANRLEFRLNDPVESEMVRGAAKTLPPNLAGRGITQEGRHFQVALPRIDSLDSTSDLNEAVQGLVSTSQSMWQRAQPAQQVRLLPSRLELAELPEPVPSGPPGVPLGIEEFRLEPFYLDLFGSEPHFMVLGDSEAGKSTLIRAWIHQLRRRYTPDQVQFLLVDYRRTLLDTADGPYMWSYAATPNLVKDAVERLRQELTARLPGIDVTRDQLLRRSWWKGPEYVVFVDDYDLVVSPSGNPISPLVEYLAQARDVGFHLVLARRVGGLARSSFEAVFQRVKELGSPGIVMSGDPQEGPIIGTQRAQLLPTGRGFLVRRGQRTALVQIGNLEPAQ